MFECVFPRVCGLWNSDTFSAKLLWRFVWLFNRKPWDYVGETTTPLLFPLHHRILERMSSNYFNNHLPRHARHILIKLAQGHWMSSTLLCSQRRNPIHFFQWEVRFYDFTLPKLKFNSWKKIKIKIFYRSLNNNCGCHCSGDCPPSFFYSSSCESIQFNFI